jgi:V/A-type H+-transporting ATPase subunit D
MAENVSPTRMNYLQRKSQVQLATQGVDLLKNKRDALMKEFFDLLKPLVEARERMSASMREAWDSLIVSLAFDGREEIESAAMASERDVDLPVEVQNIWGVLVPQAKEHDWSRSFFERGYSPATTSARVDETAHRFEDFLNSILEMSPLLFKVRKLGEEIKKTTRRVNALEQRVIPQLEEEMSFIQSTLEQREREDIFRLKRIKQKSEQNAPNMPDGMDPLED